MSTAIIHLICDEPEVTFRPDTYPAIVIVDDRWADYVVTISLIGSEAQRRAFAGRLREMADLVDAWPGPARESVVADDDQSEEADVS